MVEVGAPTEPQTEVTNERNNPIPKSEGLHCSRHEAQGPRYRGFRLPTTPSRRLLRRGRRIWHANADIWDYSGLVGKAGRVCGGGLELLLLMTLAENPPLTIPGGVAIAG